MNKEIYQNMSVSVEVDQMVVKMMVQIPYDSIEPEVHKEILDLKKRYHPPGFRKNHVPYQLIRNKFAVDIFNDITGKMTKDALTEALEKEGMSYIREPKVDLVKQELGSSFEFTAEFEKMPEFETPVVEEIKLADPEVVIGKADIDVRVNELKKQYPEWEETDQVSANDNQMVIDYTGTIEGEPFEGGSAKDQIAILGNSNFLPDFESNLLERKKGDEFTFAITFPDDYFKPTLAGKVADFTVLVKSVSIAQSVSLSKAFYARCGFSVTKKADFIDEIEKSLNSQAQQKAFEFRKKKLYDWIDTDFDFALPKNLVAEEFKRLATSMDDDKKKTIEDEVLSSDDSFAVSARKNIKISIVMKSISDKQGLSVEQADVERYFSSLGLPHDQIIQYAQWFLSDTQRSNSLVGSILEQKTLEYILKHAESVKEALSYQDLMDLNEEV